MTSLFLTGKLANLHKMVTQSIFTAWPAITARKLVLGTVKALFCLPGKRVSICDSTLNPLAFIIIKI